MGQKAIDLTGQSFSSWTVIGRGETKGTHVYWWCKCECGTEKGVPSDRLRNGQSKSCGCLRSKHKSESLTTHGRTKTPEYRAWIDMRRRCNNPKAQQFEQYGGRGINVCERWNDFNNFFVDVGERPTSKHTIERIDVNGHYEPDNCKWATWYEQSHNRRARGNSGQNGVCFKNNKWCADIRVKGKRIHLGYFDDIQDAIDARKTAELKYWKPS